jgi:hypothetical protein
MPKFDGPAPDRHPKWRGGGIWDRKSNRTYILPYEITSECHYKTLRLLKFAEGSAGSVEWPWEHIQTPMII